MGWLLPVGVPGGVNSGIVGVPEGSGLVRLGGTLISLDIQLYRLWRAAAAAVTVDELISWGAGQGIPDPSRLVTILLEAELAIAEGPDTVRHVGRLSLRLIGECLGNGGTPSPSFRMLGRAEVPVQVDAYVFQVLLRSDGVTPVAALCNELDATRQDAAHPPCLETLTAGLPLLVRNEIVELAAAQ